VIVPDVSILVPALVDQGGSGALAREWLAAHDAHVPELADVEVLSVLRRLVARGELAPDRGVVALDDYRDLGLERFPHLPLLARAWQLRDAVTAYDAQYVALAEILDVPLVTADRRLSRAPGLRCPVEVLR
jgi:predicted nucleic acid-binding protein